MSCIIHQNRIAKYLPFIMSQACELLVSNHIQSYSLFCQTSTHHLNTLKHKICYNIAHVPVMWNTDWNPNPNLPTLSTSSSLLLWLILPSDVQSLSLKTALFHA